MSITDTRRGIIRHRVHRDLSFVIIRVRSPRVSVSKFSRGFPQIYTDKSYIFFSFTCAKRSSLGPPISGLWPLTAEKSLFTTEPQRSQRFYLFCPSGDSDGQNTSCPKGQTGRILTVICTAW